MIVIVIPIVIHSVLLSVIHLSPHPNLQRDIVIATIIVIVTVINVAIVIVILIVIVTVIISHYILCSLRTSLHVLTYLGLYSIKIM